jgi:hypothetical protein
MLEIERSQHFDVGHKMAMPVFRAGIAATTDIHARCGL